MWRVVGRCLAPRVGSFGKKVWPLAAVFGVVGCGQTLESREVYSVPIPSGLEVYADLPPDSLVYVVSADEKQRMSQRGDMNYVSDPNSNSFIPIGYGGLGADLDEENRLEAYPGIPLRIYNNLGITPEVTFVVTHLNPEYAFMSGEMKVSEPGNCAGIFSWDSANNIFRIGAVENIETLTDCQIDAEVKVTQNGFSDKEKISFVVALNPTMAQYAYWADSWTPQSNDKRTNHGYQYIWHHAGAFPTKPSVVEVASYLKRNVANGNVLSQNYTYDVHDGRDPYELPHPLASLNALTGAVDVLHLSVGRGVDLKRLSAVKYLRNLSSLDLSESGFEFSDLEMLSLPKLKKLAVRKMNAKDFSVILYQLH